MSKWISQPMTAGITTAAATIDVEMRPVRESGVAGLIEARVLAGNHLVLVPLNALGRSVLSTWLGATPKLAATYRGGPDIQNIVKNGNGLERMDVEFAFGPLLSNGDDPFHSGMSISPAEAAAAREFIQSLRDAVHKPRKARKPKRRNRNA